MTQLHLATIRSLGIDRRRPCGRYRSRHVESAEYLSTLATIADTSTIKPISNCAMAATYRFVWPRDVVKYSAQTRPRQSQRFSAKE